MELHVGGREHETTSKPVKTWLDSSPALMRRLAATKGEVAVTQDTSSMQSDQQAAAPSMDHNFPFVPPLNFELVAKGGIYRSGHPNERNFSFLRSLKLKSIMYLGLEDLRPNMSGFCEEEGIQVFHIRLQLNKEPFDEMDEDEVAAALSLILDKRNLPMLVHCNKGKYRVGCIVGCLRKFQGWMQSAIFDEYSRLAGVKVADQEFIEVFDTSKIKVDPAYMLELT